MDVSFVIPSYNEENNVSALYEAIASLFRGRGVSFECVFVNDGSKDDTLKNLRKLYREHADGSVRVVSFSRNFGKEAAIYAGMHHVSGKYVCFIDADLQQQPDVALAMYDHLETHEETDCVAAYQEKRREGKILSFFKNCFYRMINRMCDVDFKQGASDFRMCRRNMIDAILSMTETGRFSKGIFTWVGFETYFMPYEAAERRSGRSKWSFRSLFRYAVDGIVGFTTVPLRIATVLGTIFSVSAIIYMLFVFIKTLVAGVDVPGYATIVILILLVGGIQLLMLGIIGEYLARTYMQVKNRPIYIEKEVLEPEGKKDAQKNRQ